MRNITAHMPHLYAKLIFNLFCDLLPLMKTTQTYRMVGAEGHGSHTNGKPDYRK